MILAAIIWELTRRTVYRTLFCQSFFHFSLLARLSMERRKIPYSAAALKTIHSDRLSGGIHLRRSASAA